MNIIITGKGSVSAAGINLAATLKTFSSEQRNAGPVSIFLTGLTYPVYEVKGLREDTAANQEMRTFKLAMWAIKEALLEAGLPYDLSGLRVGVCLGTTIASQLNDIDFYRSYRNYGTAPIIAVDRYLKGNLSEAVARTLKASGPCLTVVNACSSGTDAIGAAVSWLRSGLCDIALAGGADELSRIPLCGFGSLGILSNALCLPFDSKRDGLNLGEGAGVLVLETQENCRRRGVDATVNLAGYGLACDAYHLTAPSPDGSGLETAILRALSEAGISPQDVAFINVHGTGTIDNDRVEGTVLAKIFGPDILFCSTKGYTGHSLGAAGGLEAVFVTAALTDGWIPASAGFSDIDDTTKVFPVKEKTAVRGRYAVSTSLAFGGNNAAVVIGRL